MLKSIFEFWKYSNKDAVATLDEGEEEEINVKKIEKIFNFEDEFEEFGIDADKVQRNKYTDDELDSAYIASTNMIKLLSRMNAKIAENKEISEELKNLKILKERNEDPEFEDEDFNIFGKIKQTNNKERTLGNKTHREAPRDKYEILGIKKGLKGVELKRTLEKVLKNINSALKKNQLKEDTYAYKMSTERLDLNSLEAVSLNLQSELEEILKNESEINKLYLYKIKLPKGTDFIAFSNIIYYDNKNMTLPLGMNLSEKILIDLSETDLNETNKRIINKICFEDEEDDFSNIVMKSIMAREMEV